MPAELIRVMCVDDHRLMREGIVKILGMQSDMTVVAEARNGQEAVAQFSVHRPDVTLMDLQLPVMSGLTAIREIRKIQSDARIVVLTMYQGDEDIHRALQAGALAYVLKDSEPDALAQVIRQAYVWQTSISDEMATRLAIRASQPVLTERELQVLELLAKGRRNKEIASELWITEETTRTHIKNIFEKLDVHDRTSALAEAVRRGVVHID